MFENFGGVPVRKKIVGTKVFVYLDEKEVAPRILARSACARFAVADDILPHGDQTRLGEWAQSKNYAGCITTGIGHQQSRCQTPGIQFRQSVDGLSKTRRMWSRKVVPRRKSFRRREAESTAQIDDPQTGIQKPRSQLRRNFMGGG